MNAMLQDSDLAGTIYMWQTQCAASVTLRATMGCTVVGWNDIYQKLIFAHTSVLLFGKNSWLPQLCVDTCRIPLCILKSKGCVRRQAFNGGS